MREHLLCNGNEERSRTLHSKSGERPRVTKLPLYRYNVVSEHCHSGTGSVLRPGSPGENKGKKMHEWRTKYLGPMGQTTPTGLVDHSW